MIVVSLPGDVGLGRDLSDALNAQYVKIIHKVFPDGESYLRFPWVGSDDYLLVQSTFPEQNRRLMELIMVAKSLMRRGARSISAVIPYLAYSRQDKEFLPGEIVSAEIVLELLKSSGIRNLYVVDIHKPKVLEFFGGCAVNIVPVNSFKEYIEAQKIGRPVVIAPDEGAKHRASLLAQALGTNYLVIKKFRDRYTGKIVHSFPEALNFSGADAIIVDDIISTGGTLADISKGIKDLGAERIIALATHGLFVGEAIEKLRSSGINEIVVARTVGKLVKSIKYVDISKEVVNAVREGMNRC